MRELVPHPLGDASSLQVVGRQLDLHLVADTHANVVLPHLAAEVSKDLVATLKFDGEERIRERLADDAIHCDLRFVDAALSASGLRRHHSRAVPRGTCLGGESRRGREGERLRSIATSQAYCLAVASVTAVLWQRCLLERQRWMFSGTV